MIKAIKSLGQNFLIDKNIVNKIVNSIDAREDDLIIEIGPGQGSLTKELISKNSNLLAFEVDLRMHEFLDGLENDKFHVIYEDILKADLNKVLSNYKYNRLFVIANLPYYITTPIIEKLIDLDVKIDEMTIMVQDEVADRFSAIPGTKEYGMMSVILNYKYHIKKLFVVDKKCFNPAPKVQSAVVNLKLKKDYIKVHKYSEFKNFIAKSFSHKRKTLKNNLGNEVFNKITDILYDYNLNLNVRAEEIPVNAYIDICNKLYK